MDDDWRSADRAVSKLVAVNMGGRLSHVGGDQALEGPDRLAQAD